jgi:hypothetical protein
VASSPLAFLSRWGRESDMNTFAENHPYLTAFVVWVVFFSIRASLKHLAVLVRGHPPPEPPEPPDHPEAPDIDKLIERLEKLEKRLQRSTSTISDPMEQFKEAVSRMTAEQRVQANRWFR